LKGELQKEYWNTYYQNNHLRPNWFLTLKSIIKNILEKPLLVNFSNIYEHILWNKIFKDFLPKEKGLKVLEIGSAPGNNLIKFHKQFGYQPYGIEYSGIGAKVNRALFKENNLSEDNIFEDDFFSVNFQERFKESFDVIFSSGFVEHFTDVTPVIEKHLNLLKKNGILIITIPNLRGKVNNILCNFFHKEILKVHNLGIMELKKFRNLFNERKLKCIYCEYYGVFSFSFLNAKNIFKQFLLDICLIMQCFINFFLRLIANNNNLESKHTSPFLLFIGKKL